MREIKFRARDVVTGEVLTQLYMGQCFQWVNHERQNNIIIEQYTGLKDKNGVEIYEGDICVNEKGRVAKCVYHEPSASFDFVALNCIGDNYGYKAQMWKYKLAIIGNIHQNPELLNDKPQP